MPASIWFWILYVISVVFGGYWGWTRTQDQWPMYLVLYILIGLLGWGIFGSPLK